jgi:hypothetical protein
MSSINNGNFSQQNSNHTTIFIHRKNSWLKKKKDKRDGENRHLFDDLCKHKRLLFSLITVAFSHCNREEWYILPQNEDSGNI